MALRFTAEFYDVKEQQWKVEIHDSNFSGDATTIRLTGEGFTTRWEGDDTTLYSGLMPSSTTIECINQGGDFETFLGEVPNKSEGDVRVDIFEAPSNNGNATTLWWSGVLLIDGIQQEDAPTPNIVTLQATDDLAQLKSVRWQYTDPAGFVAGDLAGISHKLSRCFWECRNWDAISSSGPAWTSVLDFQLKGYTTAYLNSPALGPDLFTDIDFSVGTSPNEINPVDGSAPAWFLWDILQSIAVTFNCRIFFARGCWRIHPIATHYMEVNGTDWAATRYYGFKKDGTAHTLNPGSIVPFKQGLRPGVNYPKRINGSDILETDERLGLQKQAGGLLTHSTPVKYVKRQQDGRGNFYISGNSILYNGATNSHILDSLADLERIDTDDDRTFFAGAAFSFNGNINLSRPAGAYAGTNNTLIAKLDIVWDVGDYRWKGPTTGWSTDQTGSYSITLGSDNFSSGIQIIEAIDISTESSPLPVDSDGMELTATLRFLNGYGGDITTSLVTGAQSTPATTAISVLHIDFLNDSNSEQLHFIAETSRSNKVTLDQGAVLIGSTQGQLSVGHIEGGLAIETAAWRDSDKWKSYNLSSAELNIHRLGVNEVAATHEVGREIQSGVLLNSAYLRALTPMVTLRTTDTGTDADYWAPLQLSTFGASRSSEVTRMRLDWDGTTANITNPTDDHGSTSADNTDSEGPIPGTFGTPPVSPMPNVLPSGGFTPSGASTKSATANTGAKLEDVKTKTDNISVDADNGGITSLTIASGSTPITADDIDDAATTNKFASSGQLAKVDHLTINAATDLDTMRSDVSTNNAKVGLSSSDTNKLGTITLNAGGSAITNIALEGEVVRASNIQTNASRSFATTTQLNSIASNTLSITSHTDSISDIEDKTDLISISAQHNLDTTKDKVGHIAIDGTNGITSLTIKSGSTPITADEVSTTGTTNKFSTQAQLNKVNYLTITKATNLDTHSQKISYITATSQGITGFTIPGGGQPLTADQVDDGSTSAKFTDADGVQALGHLTSDATGITQIQVSTSVDLNLDDAAALFAGGSGTAANRSGFSNDRIATIEPDGGLGELSSGSKGQWLYSGGTTAAPNWGVPPYVLAAHSTRVSLYYTNRYYMGSSLYGWSTDTSYSTSQTGRTSLIDDYAHMGIVAPTDISTLKLYGTIRNDTNAADITAWILKGSRPNGSTSSITLTDLIEVNVTIAAADRHYNMDGTANSANISAGDLIFVFFQRKELPNGSTLANISYTLHATP